MSRHSNLQLLACDIVENAVAERALRVTAQSVQNRFFGVSKSAANVNQAASFSPERLSGLCAGS